MENIGCLENLWTYDLDLDTLADWGTEKYTRSALPVGIGWFWEEKCNKYGIIDYTDLIGVL